MKFIGEGPIEATNLNYPWEVTVNGLNEIFVSDSRNNRIVVFNEKGEFLMSFSKMFLSVQEDTKTGRSFVSSRNNNKILLFGSNGEYVSTIHSGESLKAPCMGNIARCSAKEVLLSVMQEIDVLGLFLPKAESFFKTVGTGRLHMPFDCL